MAAAAVQPIAVHNDLLAAVQVVDRVLKGRGRENNQYTGVLYLRNMGVIAAKLDLKDLVLSHFPSIKRWFVPMAPMLLLDWNRLFSAYTSYLRLA